MSLPLTISGNPAGIRVAAEWLSTDLAGTLSEADLELAWAVADAQYHWVGESGYAFNSAAQAIRRGNFAVPAYAKDVAEVLRAYAGRLERGAADFADYAEYARGQGLVASAKAIQTPTTWLNFCPDPEGEDSRELREWNRYQHKVDVYNDLSSRVGTWWGELEVWVAEQFATLVADIEKLQEARSVYEGLVSGNSEVVGFALDYADARTARDLEGFRAKVSELQARARTSQAQLRSGNPALKAAAEAADPRGLRQSARALTEMIDGVSKAGKIIPVAGVAIDIVATGAEIANGGSESSALIGLAAGLGGGAAAVGGIAALGVAVPPVGVAILAGAAAWGAGEVATMAWEAWVPLDTREAIDAGVEDFFEFINPASWFVATP